MQNTILFLLLVVLSSCSDAPREFVEYHEDGTEAARGFQNTYRGVEYVNWTTFHLNGEVDSIGTSHDGEKVGWWSFYMEDGELDLDRSGWYEEGIWVEPIPPEGIELHNRLDRQSK